jgi:hypothetical protein
MFRVLKKLTNLTITNLGGRYFVGQLRPKGYLVNYSHNLLKDKSNDILKMNYVQVWRLT